MRFLITGGAGFIGSHLCEQLSRDVSYRVVSLDNYSTGSVDNHVANVEYIRGDTKDIQSLVTFVPDIVFHLGEYSRVEQSFDDLETVWDYNKTGTFEVLQFCRKHACKIVYAGSSTKFGDGGLFTFPFTLIVGPINVLDNLPKLSLTYNFGTNEPAVM